MDFKGKEDVPNPKERAGGLNRLFYCWLIPLFVKGRRKRLEVDDLYNCLHEDEAQRLGGVLEREWNSLEDKFKEKKGQPKLYKALINAFWKDYVANALLLLLDDCIIRVGQTLFLRELIRSFSILVEDGESVEGGLLERYKFGGLFLLVTLLHIIVINPATLGLCHVGMKCRVACSSLIYRKALKMEKVGKKTFAVGELVNLLSNDVNRFDRNIFFTPYLLIGPIQCAIFLYIVWRELGFYSLGGFGLIVLLAPLQYFIGKAISSVRLKVAEATDTRGRIMNEVIIGIRLIKMYAWEVPFSKLVTDIRRTEVNKIRGGAILRVFIIPLFQSTSKLIPFLTFVTYAMSGNPLQAYKVFFCVSIFDIMRKTMVLYIPSGVSGLAEIFVSCKRIESLLVQPEHKSPDSPDEIRRTKNRRVQYVAFKNASASWPPGAFTLSNLTTNLLGNKLVMVVGSVGSGKSSLLQAIMGELPLELGIWMINGRISYASQEPWIFPGSFKSNVLFGMDFDDDYFHEVIRVCALQDDLRQLPHGEQSIVGERGSSLSGGQKARLNLARAVYRKADIYLLDDPLSAVDPKVSRHIFENCFQQYLNGKLRILVTHQLQYLPLADHVIVLENVKIATQGSYVEIVSKGWDFGKLAEQTEEAAHEIVENPVDSVKERIRRYSRKPSTVQVLEEEGREQLEDQNKEQITEGAVGLRDLWDYVKAGGSRSRIVTIGLGLLVAQIASCFTDYWLALWVRTEEEWIAENRNPFLPRETLMIIYGVGAVSVGLFTVGTAINFFLYSTRISSKLHDNMFSAVLNAPTRFFDTNPSGRILNRFAKDQGAVDEILPSTLYDTVTIMFLGVGAAVVIIVSNYLIAGPMIILIFLLTLARKFYIPTSRSITKSEAVARSPAFTFMACTMQGLSTIRSSRTQDILIVEFDKLLDMHSSAWYLFITSNRTFAFWLEIISWIFLNLVLGCFLIMSTGSGASGSLGLAISATIELTGSFQWGLRQLNETENLMIAVKRITEYCKLQPEAAIVHDTIKPPPPPSGWPSKGQICFQDVSLAYGENVVLRNLTFSIQSGEKIGVVGRTGAGKSSIITALFRMTEPAGVITLDGVNVTEIALYELRKNISIIPQEPIMFWGTVRFNLDPFAALGDDVLWSALEEVGLREVVDSLEFQVADEGTNFSIGQRQLFCLARAILRNNKVLVMDEATANIDPKTDAVTQETLRRKFGKCSIITIAHRLQSVIDSDKILVLSKGVLKEFNHPHILLSDPDGEFTSMISQTGRAATGLREMALKSYESAHKRRVKL